MRKMFAIKTIVVAGALSLLAVGCGAGTADNQAGSAANGSVKELAAQASMGIELDYTPLASPADAVRKADLIVQGTLVQVSDGIQVQHAGQESSRRAPGSYATFVVSVDKVVSGEAGRVTSGRVYVEVFKSSAATPKGLSALNPGAKIVAVLDDITTWRPNPSARVQRPGAVPAQAGLYAPYNDGLWLQGAKDGQMYGIGVEHDELGNGWAGTRTVDQFTAGLTKAAKAN